MLVLMVWCMAQEIDGFVGDLPYKEAWLYLRAGARHGTSPPAVVHRGV